MREPCRWWQFHCWHRRKDRSVYKVDPKKHGAKAGDVGLMETRKVDQCCYCGRERLLLYAW